MTLVRAAPVAPPAVVDPGIPTGSASVDVIVQGREGVSWGAVRDAVRRAGGEVVAPLPIVDGASVRIAGDEVRSEEHTSELQSLMRISYAVFCLKKKKTSYNT